MVAAIESTIFGFRYGGRVIEPSQSAIDEADKARLDRYRKYWNMYKGSHWDTPRGGGDPDEKVITLNYSKRITDIMVNFLMKGGFDITVPDDPKTPEDESATRTFVKQKLDDTWRMNDKSLLAFEIGQLGGVTGDCFTRISWEENDPLEGAFPRIEPLPSQYVFPSYGGSDGLNRRRMLRCKIMWPQIEEVLVRTMFRGPKVERKVVWYSEVWTAKKREKWREDKLIEEAVNPFGEIPVVHIPNYPIAGEPFGISDIQTITDLNVELNDKATDISDVINYHGSPITVVIGAKVSTLEKGANRVWGLPPGADIKNLELNGDLSASLNFFNLLRKGIFDLSGTPEAALSGPEHIAGTSGATLAQAYLPLIEQRDVKLELYGRGIRMINRLLLKVWQLKDEKFATKFKDLPKENRFRTQVKFGEPLPRDESVSLDQSVKRIDNGLSTRKLELQRLGHGEADADRIVEEAFEEKKRWAELDMGMMSPMQDPEKRSGNPDPKRPDPDSQGDKVSRKSDVKPR